MTDAVTETGVIRAEPRFDYDPVAVEAVRGDGIALLSVLKDLINNQSFQFMVRMYSGAGPFFGWPRPDYPDFVPQLAAFEKSIIKMIQVGDTDKNGHSTETPT